MNLHSQISVEAFVAFRDDSLNGRADAVAFGLFLARHIRHLLPHRQAWAMAGIWPVGSNGNWATLNIEIQAVGEKTTQTQISAKQRIGLAQWLDGRQPLVLGPLHEVPSERIAVHGQVDQALKQWSCFGFLGIPTELDAARLKLLLRLITPHLHAALPRRGAGHSANAQTSSPVLTPGERELLHRLALGESNEEIASRRGRSTATVRNQLHSLYRKLGVTTRAEAVGRASAMNLFRWNLAKE